MWKKVYLLVIHILAVIGLSTVYLSVSASLGVSKQRTVVERPDGCLTGESDKIFSQRERGQSMRSSPSVPTVTI